MRYVELLPQEGAFYKANLHAHTTFSDGKLTPEQLKEAYRKQGYSIVAITDHRHYGWYPELMDENFIPLAAFEADLNCQNPKAKDFSRTKTYHINFYDCNPTEKQSFQALQPPQIYGDIPSLNSFVQEMKQKGFLACYNHPYWSLQNYDDYKDLKHFDFMEIYNHGCELDGLYGYHPQAYDEMLRTGQKIGCFATDDNHNSHPFESPRCDSFGGFTMFKLPDLSYQSVIEAMKQGNYYASTGPEIFSLIIQDDVLTVTCSPVEKIYLITEGRYTYSELAQPGVDGLTQAQFMLKGNEGYIRIDCQDSHRRHAYSRAYFLDEYKDK